MKPLRTSVAQLSRRFSWLVLLVISAVGSYAALATAQHMFSPTISGTTSSLALNNPSTMCPDTDASKEGQVLFVGCGGFF